MNMALESRKDKSYLVAKKLNTIVSAVKDDIFESTSQATCSPQVTEYVPSGTS